MKQTSDVETSGSNNDQLIQLTPIAKERVKSIVDSEDLEVEGLRISITGRTANTFEYSLGLEVELHPDDVVIDLGDLKVLVDSQSMDSLKGSIIDYVEDLNASGFRVDNPNQPTWDDSRAQKIQELIDTRINPSVASHGGNIQLLDVTEDSVYVHMGGGCQGCGQASATLKQGVQTMIQEEFPEIVNVIDTTDHAAGTNPYYQ
ncbi:Fe/S biogenesis protein NfuA [Candidatus Poribacteria bacterium]|jgi:Fe/S biogenesis protein NfuA|nr:Fe/S biogenesis protein NfuA [Candidatus Poribacteria bacterium]MBD72158.1 Fe/S biogenesis protein NfuA [Candidatus Poribacteria bacterium]|tara:strand:- start:1554 stop:2162 length:609 start_codon:yes stop_codon:yes gene_type:complete